MMSLAPPSD